jgi:flavin reductase (DIM6/NTAB) family NADH-FMN oxidoreductase RutF
MAKKQLEPSTLIPCMVVLVTCQGVDGKANVSAISEGGVLCNHPPMLGISITRSHLSNKQIKETGEFVINVPPEELIYQVDVCGCVTGRKADKFALTGLTIIPSRVVKVPSIKECPVNIECKVKHVLNMGIDDLFIGEVVSNVADEEILLKGAEGEDHIAFSKPALDGYKWRPYINLHGTGHYWNLKERLEPLFYSAKQKKRT